MARLQDIEWAGVREASYFTTRWLLTKALPGFKLNEHIAACQLGFEGIVSKRLDSRYTSGRSGDWLKFNAPEIAARRPDLKKYSPHLPSKYR